MRWWCRGLDFFSIGLLVCLMRLEAALLQLHTVPFLKTSSPEDEIVCLLLLSLLAMLFPSDLSSLQMCSILAAATPTFQGAGHGQLISVV